MFLMFYGFFFNVLVCLNILQDWKFLKALFSISGNKSLQHQMNNIDISQISESAALKARDIIELIDADMVRCTSALAYDMYRWVRTLSCSYKKGVPFMIMFGVFNCP